MRGRRRAHGGTFSYNRKGYHMYIKEAWPLYLLSAIIGVLMAVM